mgnify:FL=1
MKWICSIKVTEVGGGISYTPLHFEAKNRSSADERLKGLIAKKWPKKKGWKVEVYIPLMSRS